MYLPRNFDKNFTPRTVAQKHPIISTNTSYKLTFNISIICIRCCMPGIVFFNKSIYILMLSKYENTKCSSPR